MSESAQVIVYFFSNIDVFLLIISRLLGFVIIFPVLAGANIPMTAKITFAVAMAYVVFAANLVINVSYDNSLIGFGLLIVEEFIVGFIIAFVVYIVFSVMYFAGQLIDMQIGFSMVSIFDPVTQIQVPIVGNLLFMLMSFYLVQTGGLHAFVSALFFSYDAIPVGHALLLDNGGIMGELIKLMLIYFTTGVQVAMPIMGSILMIDIAMGLLVKAVPQMNFFVVGMPMKVLAGLAIFYFILPVFYDIYEILFSQAMRSVIVMIRGLTP